MYSEASFLLGQLAFGVKDATVGYSERVVGISLWL